MDKEKMSIEEINELIERMVEDDSTYSLDEMSAEDKARKSMVDIIGQSFASTFTKVNRILLGDYETQIFLEDGKRKMIDAPAWTDGEDVYLNKRYVAKSFANLVESNQINFKNIAEVKGLNYHELAHIFFTPRMNSKISKEVRKMADQFPDYWYAYNVLEDLRAEMSMVMIFPKIVDYFSIAVFNYILNQEDDDVSNSYMLLSGRYFLPIETRMEMRSLFAQEYGENFTKNMEQIVEDYVKNITYTNTRWQEGYDLIERFVIEVLKPMRTKSGKALPKCIGGSQHVNDKDAGAGRGHWKKVQQGGLSQGSTRVQDQKLVKPFIEELIKEVNETIEDIKSNEVTNLGTKAGRGQADNQSVKDVKASLEEIIEIYESNPNFKNDVEITKKDILAKIEKAVEDINVVGITAKPMLVAPSPSTLSLKSQIDRFFRQLRIDLEQDWLRGRKTGIVDMNRLMRTQHLPRADVFKKWKPSEEDAATSECVILLDMSGSMDSVARSASEVVWILKQSLDKIGVRTTVLGFANQCYIVYKPNQKAQRGQVPVYATGGGTQPEYALKQALNVLRTSDRNNKFVVALTDGAWTDSDKEIELVREITKEVDSSNLLFYGGYFDIERAKDKDNYAFGNFTNIKQIKKLEDTLDIVKSIVSDITNKYIY